MHGVCMRGACMGFACEGLLRDIVVTCSSFDVHELDGHIESSLYANDPLCIKDLLQMKDLLYMQEPMDMRAPCMRMAPLSMKDLLHMKSKPEDPTYSPQLFLLKRVAWSWHESFDSSEIKLGPCKTGHAKGHLNMWELSCVCKCLSTPIGACLNS